jgi:hypothetical protein
MKRINKETKKRVMEIVNKVNDDKHEVSWENGDYKFKKKKNIKQGKKSRAQGANFELRVRKDLEEKGRIVDKWTNNFDLEEGKVVAAKRKFNPFSKVMTIGTGFPDFISIQKIHNSAFSVIGVEVKMNGKLSKEEKQKCIEYLKKGVFSEIWIAKKEKEGRRVKVVYEDFRERYGDRYD